MPHNILIVDDPGILEGLKRTLRSQRGDLPGLMLTGLNDRGLKSRALELEASDIRNDLADDKGRGKSIAIKI